MRLVRCVWEMTSRGIIRQGVVSSEIVAAVATDGMLIGRMAAGMINSERDVNQVGARLSKFIGRVHNTEGYHAETVGKAACALSMFSCAELEAVFRSDSAILRAVCTALCRLTRSKMYIPVHEEYTSFTTEALAFTLPMVQQRRESLGICKFMRTNELLDLLRTVPAAANWTPLRGKLRLHLEDLRQGHSFTRTVLDALHEGRVLVRRKGGGTTRNRLCYEFDTETLCAVFRKELDIKPRPCSSVCNDYDVGLQQLLRSQCPTGG